MRGRYAQQGGDIATKQVQTAPFPVQSFVDGLSVDFEGCYLHALLLR